MISAAELLDLPFDEDDNIRFFPATEEWATVADMTQEDLILRPEEVDLATWPPGRPHPNRRLKSVTTLP